MGWDIDPMVNSHIPVFKVCSTAASFSGDKQNLTLFLTTEVFLTSVLGVWLVAEAYCGVQN